MAPFRALATPLADMIRPMPYPDMYPQEEGDFHPGAALHNGFADAIGLGEAETIVEHLQAPVGSMRVAQLRVLGGAMARVPADATAFAHRTRRIIVNVAAMYEAPEDRAASETWVAGLAEALRQGEPAAYVNFMGDEGEERVREGYPGSTWGRLVAIKARYDPTNLFRLNQNIPLAG